MILNPSISGTQVYIMKYDDQDDLSDVPMSPLSTGHIYSAQNDYGNALSSHQQGVALMKSMGNELAEARGDW